MRWYHQDYLGSVTAVSHGDGTLDQEQTYSAFGTLTAGTMVDRYGWTGREFDADTSLYYDRARWYDPTTRRFMTEDPMDFQAGDYNLYRYVGNQPTRYTDPSGMDWWPWSSSNSSSAAIAGAAATGAVGEGVAAGQQAATPARGCCSDGTPELDEMIGKATPNDSMVAAGNQLGINTPNSTKIGDAGTRLLKSLEELPENLNRTLNPLSGALDNNPNSIGGTSFLGGLVPIYGSGRNAINDFQNGRLASGLLNTAFLVGDLVGVGELASVAKNGIKNGLEKLVSKTGAELAGDAEKTGVKVAEELAPKHGPNGVHTEAPQPHGNGDVHAGVNGSIEPGQSGGATVNNPNTRTYPDGSVRTADGKFAGNTGINPGTPAVRQAEQIIQQRPGWEVVGKEISVRDANGTLRRYDLVAKNPAGEFVGIEVKGGTGRPTGPQRAIDASLNKNGGLDTVGKRASDAGIDRIASTETVNVP